MQESPMVISIELKRLSNDIVCFRIVYAISRGKFLLTSDGWTNLVSDIELRQVEDFHLKRP